MKSKILSVAAVALMFAACNEPLNEAAEVEMDSLNSEVSVKQTEDEVLEKDVQFRKFSEILSKAVSQNKSVREFLKEKALEKIDNDYNVFYPIVRNEMIDGKSFESILGEYADNKEELKKVFEVLPLLNIHIPELVKQVADFDTEDDEIPVLYNYEMYCNGQVVDTLDADEIPGFDVLVINESVNIRKKTNLSKIATNSLFHGEYEYVDDIYNPIFTKLALSKKTEGYETYYAPYHSNSLNSNYIDPELIRAYNLTSNQKNATRAAMYYNWTRSDDNSTNIRYDVQDCIFRFKLSPEDFYGYEGTAHILEPNNKNSVLGNSTTHKKSELSREDVLNKLINGYSLRFKFVYESAATSGEVHAMYYYLTVPMIKVFDFYIDRDRVHSTWVRHSKYTYTLNKDCIRSKWIYPTESGRGLNFPRWDVTSDPIKKRIIVLLENQHSNTTVQEESNYKRYYANSAKLGVDIGVEKTIKLGISGELSSSYSREESAKLIYNMKEDDLDLGAFDVDYFLDYPILDICGNNVYFKDINCGNFSITILPMTNAFYSRKISNKSL